MEEKHLGPYKTELLDLGYLQYCMLHKSCEGKWLFPVDVPYSQGWEIGDTARYGNFE